METHFLLQNYIENSLPTRGKLFDFAISILEKKTSEFKYSVREDKEEDLSNFRSVIQLQLIAIIMMYIEDLIIFLEGNQLLDQNYYDLLDQKNPDVGERITEFFDHLEEKTPKEYRRMLSYISSYSLMKLFPKDSKRDLVNSFIESNIIEFKKFLLDLRNFRNTHTQTFRRYKHGGLAIRMGLKTLFGSYPYTSKQFESVSIVFEGDLFRQSIPIPYSNEVLEGYRYLAIAIQNMLDEIIRNKMSCIERHIDGLIPLENYSSIALTDEQRSDIISMISDLDHKRPIQAYDNVIIPTIQPSKDKIQWYIELEGFLTRCKNNKQIYSNARDRFEGVV